MGKPIRILQCMPANMGCGGIENFVMNVYRNIDRNKIQFDFLVHGNGENFFEKEIKQLGGKIYKVPLIRDYKRYSQQMKKILYENKYQTIHIHSMYAISYFDANIAKKCKVKNIIVHSHSSNTNIKKRKMVQQFLRKPLSQVANYHLSCSKEAAKWMFSNEVVKKQKYQIIKNAIYVENYQFNPAIRGKLRKELQLEGKFVIGHVGRLSAAKNHIFLLEIFKEILKKEKNAILLLVGNGELKEKIEQKVEELNIMDKVIFMGNSKEVAHLLQVMDVFVFPSLFEGFGLAALEAQITGLPCFLANHITREVNVADTVEFVSLEETPEQWANRVLNKKEYKRENKAGLVKKKKYDIIDMAKDLEVFYLKIN